MKKITIKDIFELFLVMGLLYVVYGLVANYLSKGSGWFETYCLDSPQRMLTIFLMGIILYILLMGEITAKRLGVLILGVLLMSTLFLALRFVLVQGAVAVQDIVRWGGITWSFTAFFALSIWLYGFLFGLLLHLASGRKNALTASASARWRWLWLVACLALTLLYQKSIETAPHTRLMDYQGLISQWIYYFLPLASIFWDILRFRAGQRAGKAKPAEPLSQPAETPSDSLQ